MPGFERVTSRSLEGSSTIRLEFSWQEDDGDDVHVTERWTQTRSEALAELRSLSDDPAWLERVTTHLPVARPGG